MGKLLRKWFMLKKVFSFELYLKCCCLVDVCQRSVNVWQVVLDQFVWFVRIVIYWQSSAEDQGQVPATLMLTLCVPASQFMMIKWG